MLMGIILYLAIAVCFIVSGVISLKQEENKLSWNPYAIAAFIVFFSLIWPITSILFLYLMITKDKANEE